jgi:hypothetical protein
MMSLRSKWAAGKAVRAGLAVEDAYLNRYVTDEQRSRRPIFNATLAGRGQLAVFPRCSLDPYESRSWLFARALKNSRLTRRPPGDNTIICETVHYQAERCFLAR